jgi:predicted ATP-dependent endonuclease of OLD family
MKNIFINNLTVKNYKCFNDESIHFNIPNGENVGSGLNILIGENGNGKTAILEAINFLTLSSFSAENRLKINDFTDYKNEIVIKGETSVFTCKSSIDAYNYNGWSFEANGIMFTAKSRDIKERGKLLSSLFDIKNHFIINNDQYKKKDSSVATDKEGKIKVVDGRDKIFDNSRISNDGINIFFFDKNRTRQIVSGTYKTTFEKICDDLNWKFTKEVNSADDDKKKALIDNICGEYFKNVIDIVQKGAGNKVASELKDFFKQDDYNNLTIELLDLLHPFSNAFFATRENNSLKQIKIRDLGSGVEMILTLLLLKNIAEESKGSIIYLIDEPELHLHPKAQEKLLNLLFEESKEKQIFISTHSPYIFKNCLSKNVGLLLFCRDENNKINITDAQNKEWGLFPWSPSWGEINYNAYDLPTVEFHNELYGYLQDKSRKTNIDDFDQYLKNERGISDLKKYKRNGLEKVITLCTYVRNQIHHPENKNNIQFTKVEFRKSVDLLMDLLKQND